MNYDRVSCEKGDPGEAAYNAARLEGKKVIVYLDGVNQPEAVTADVEEGWVRRFKKNEEGLVIDPDKEEIVIEVVHGDVRVVLE